MSSPYALFETDKSVEKGGVRIDYGAFWFQIARAGGGNERFSKQLRQLLQPYRRAIETETMDGKVMDRIMVDTFIDTCLLAWGSEEHGDGKLAGREGEVLEFTKENAKRLFEDLPDLLTDLVRQSNKVALFRKTILDADLGNSERS